MTAESNVRFYPMKTWVRVLYVLFLPIVGFFLWGAGVGVSDQHLVLKGFSTKRIPWADIASLRQGVTVLGGAGGALVESMVPWRPLLLHRTRGIGALTVPVHQTTDPKALLSAIGRHMDETRRARG